MLLIIFFFLDEEYKLIPDLFKFADFDKCIFYSTDLNPTYCKVAVELSPEDRSQTNILWSTIEVVRKLKLSSNFTIFWRYCRKRAQTKETIATIY